MDPAISETAKRTLMLDGTFSRIMDTLTGGVILAGLALHLGANSFLVGVLASLPFLAQGAQLFAVQLLMRVRNRKAVVVWSVGIARTLFILLAALVWFYGRELGPMPLVAVIAANALLAVFSTAAWNWWIRDVVPRDELGRYFGRRLRFSTFLAMLFLLAGGYFLDRAVETGRGDDGYALLFLAGGLAGYLSIYFLLRTPHPTPPPAPAREPATTQIVHALREGQAGRLAVALIFVTSTLTIALPFTAIYLLRSASFSVLWVTSFYIVSNLAYVGSLRGWGHLSDRFGHRPVLQISTGLLATALIGWSIAWTDRTATLIGLLILIHFLSGFAVAGIELSVHNLVLKTAPEANPLAYISGLLLVRATAAGLVTLAAGAAWQAIGSGALAALTVPFGATWTIRGFHVLALASVGVAVTALLLLRSVPEEGGAPTVDVARAMRREVRMISSVAGIRAFVHVVSYVVEFLSTRPPPPPAALDRTDTQPPEPEDTASVANR